MPSDSKWISILKSLCSVPTAPFAEQAVMQFVEQFLAERPKLRLSRDRSGNLLVTLRGNSKLPRWVFTAHMDHPGFVARKMLDARTLQADFRGGVEASYFKGSKVRFFDGDRAIPATVMRVDLDRDKRPCGAKLRVSQAVGREVPGMWDQGEGRVVGRKFLSRVCDDLAGAAAALAMIDELSRKPSKAPIAVLLTRAEEEGFIGAIAASIEPQLLKKSDRIIAIETSAAQPYAPQGNGAIIRVGDRTSIFNSGLTYFISQAAIDLAKKDRSFAYQRALMPGGTCEATVYDAYGFAAASICIALGNYHNMDKARKKIAPEHIDLNDWRNMVKLFIAVARTGHEYAPGHAQLKQRIEKRFDKWRHLL